MRERRPEWSHGSWLFTFVFATCRREDTWRMVWFVGQYWILEMAHVCGLIWQYRSGTRLPQIYIYIYIHVKHHEKTNSNQKWIYCKPKHRTRHLSSRSLVSCTQRSSGSQTGCSMLIPCFHPVFAGPRYLGMFCWKFSGWGMFLLPWLQATRSPRFWSRLVNKLWYFRMFELGRGFAAEHL